jgi:hypothetical protein
MSETTTYVVLHDLVTEKQRGQLIDTATLERWQPGMTERCLRLGGIRLATPAEIAAGKGDLPDADASDPHLMPPRGVPFLIERR